MYRLLVCSLHFSGTPCIVVLYKLLCWKSVTSTRARRTTLANWRGNNSSVLETYTHETPRCQLNDASLDLVRLVSDPKKHAPHVNFSHTDLPCSSTCIANSPTMHREITTAWWNVRPQRRSGWTSMEEHDCDSQVTGDGSFLGAIKKFASQTCSV